VGVVPRGQGDAWNEGEAYSTELFFGYRDALRHRGFAAASLASNFGVQNREHFFQGTFKFA